MIEYANLFLSAISALSSIVQAVNSKKSLDIYLSASQLTSARDRSITPYKKGGKNIALIIDDSLLEALIFNINAKLNSLTIIFSDNSSSWEEKAAIVEEAKLEICYSLMQIKIMNRDELPTKRLENLWLSHGCKHGN